MEAVSNELKSLENGISETDKTILGFCDELNIKPPFNMELKKKYKATQFIGLEIFIRIGK